MRRFEMHRKVDETGISGTGHIADGCLFDDGTVVVRWRTATPGTTTFASLDHAKAVHGHAGATRFVFRDPPLGDGDPEEFFCTMCFATDEFSEHCFNCGSGGTNVSLPKSFIALIRKNASWVGRRFYASDEDKAEYAERKALRCAIGRWPGRSVEPIVDSDDVWVKQVTSSGTCTMITASRRGRTDEQIILDTADALPWAPDGGVS